MVLQIKSKCMDALANSGEGRGAVEECLKASLARQEIHNKECIKVGISYIILNTCTTHSHTSCHLR